MSRSLITAFRALVFVWGCQLGVALPAMAAGTEDFRLLQQAIQQAIAAADPSVVKIETVGGMDLVGEILTGTGPTTGVVLREDGYIVTSRFNFLSKPASVVVTLADERRFAAEIVSDDLSRMLTLLKIDASGLPVLQPVPKEEIRVGMTALALGRTFDQKFPNASVGIVSALNRVWGRALQTDAKTSPVNYGGPLIDLTGRCLGVIVPLSPEEQGETAGVEWYDSGIGFAVPFADIQALLPRMIAEKELKPGLMGIGFEDAGPVSGAAKAIRVRPESPADQAGIQTDDVVIGINGQSVTRLNDLKQILGTLYAKDVARLKIRRGEQVFEKELLLADELKAYQFPYLGVLPSRQRSVEGAKGVPLRGVIEGSPAFLAGIQTGDVIELAATESVSTREELSSRIRRFEPHAEMPLTIRREKETKTLSARLVPFPDEPPASLKPDPIPLNELPPQARTGRLNEQLPGDGLSFWAYIPENYRPDYRWGLLVWLHPAGDTQEAEMLRAWTDVCRERGILLLGPRSGDVGGWPADLEAPVEATVKWMQERYTIDPARICVMGDRSSSLFATKFAFKYRELVRGLVLLSAPVRIPPPDNDPDFPLQILLASSQGTPLHRQTKAVVEALRKRNFPTWLIELKKEDESPFPDELLSPLVRWLDALDRL
jgi:serine protease Do